LLIPLTIVSNCNIVSLKVGTSGDTGSAAIDSVRGMSLVDIIVLYPKGQITEVQELQMRSGTEENVHLFEVEGTCDELDEPIGQCFPDPTLTCMNSINWARVMIQVCSDPWKDSRQLKDSKTQ